MFSEIVQGIVTRRDDAVAAIDDQGEILTYGELIRRADALMAAIGPTRQLILLEGQNSTAWLVAYVAALRGRHPILMAPAGNVPALAQLEAAFAPTFRLTAAHGYQPEALPNAAAPLHPELALMLSTSGSTGSAKCVRLSYDNIDANAASICRYLEIGPDERGLASLPTHYSYGLSIVNSHLRAGATLLLTSRSVIEPSYWHFAGEHGATSFGGVPHSYELLSRIDLAAHAPSTLRYFTQAGGRLPEAHVRHFATLAAEHGWRFFVMYGQTEATARMAYLPPDDVTRKPDSIGIAIPGGAFFLQDEDGRPIDGPGQTGELVYEGPNVMMGYATCPADLSAEPGSKRLVTGDLARRDEAGYHYITGRLSRFVKIFGNRIGLDDVERILADEGHAAIATGIDDQLLVITRSADSVAAIAAVVTERLKLPPAYFTVRAVEEYPLLASGKIDYARLKASLTPAAASEPTAQAGTKGSTAIVDTFVQAFGEDAKDENASFMSLGGDSLNYLVVALGLETILGDLPDDWTSQSIGALITLAEQRAATDRVVARRPLPRNLDTLRGLACTLVVMYHVVGSPDGGLRLPATSAWHYFVDSFTYARMPLFTAMAGFIYAAMPVAGEGFPHFVARKAKLLLIPLVFVTIVNWAARGSLYNGFDDLVEGLLHGYLHLWFLYALMGIFIIVAVLDLSVGTSWKFWTAMLLVVPAVRLTVPLPTVFSIHNAIYLLEFFIVGMLVHREPWLLRAKPLLVVAGITCIALLGVQQLVLMGRAPNSLLLPLAFPCGSAIALLLIRFFPRLEWCEALGAYSFTIYLWHPAANALVRLLMIDAGFTTTWLLFVAGTAGGVLIPVALHRATMRLPRWISLPVIGK